MSKFTILKNISFKISLNKWIGILFLVFYILNTVQLIKVYQNTVQLNRITQEEFARMDPKTLQQELSSKEYVEVFLKNKLYQKTNEIVLDTKSIEGPKVAPVKNEYLKNFNKEDSPNFVLWFKCFFDDYKKDGKCF